MSRNTPEPNWADDTNAETARAVIDAWIALALPQRLLKPEEAAPILGVSLSTLYRSIAQHQIPIDVVYVSSSPRLPWLAVARLAALGRA